MEVLEERKFADGLDLSEYFPALKKLQQHSIDLLVGDKPSPTGRPNLLISQLKSLSELVEQFELPTGHLVLQHRADLRLEVGIVEELAGLVGGQPEPNVELIVASKVARDASERNDVVELRRHVLASHFEQVAEVN